MAKDGKVVDLHSHTYYSHCSRDNPHDLVVAAIQAGVDVLGINDHDYGIADRKAQYEQEIRALAEQYKEKIQILCGIEVATTPNLYDADLADCIQGYDYCLIEHLLLPNGMVGDDVFSFCRKLNIPCGIAHTDLFAYCDQHGFAYKDFFEKMAKMGIFWEMNVNYDSIHSFREHEYVKQFFANEEKMAIVRKAGVVISVGFDSHKCEEYDASRVQSANRLLREKGLKTVEDHSVLGKLIF